MKNHLTKTAFVLLLSVKMKSGEKKIALLNYNLVDQELVFMQKDQYWVLDNPHLIDTVHMANRTFISLYIKAAGWQLSFFN